MEELKNENVTEQPVVEEPVVEQRPSTKYGRTAYQQQLQEEHAAQSRHTPEQPQQNGYQYWEGPQNPYQQGEEQPYQQYQQYNAYTPYQDVKPEVKNWYAYVLMALIAVSTIFGAIANILMMEAFNMGSTILEVAEAIVEVSEQPAVSAFSSVSNLCFWATIAFLILDIIQLNKAGKKITGAVLFAIFLRPAYFIWRAHLLGQKKAISIIYTIIIYMISFAQNYVFISAYMDMVFRVMY